MVDKTSVAFFHFVRRTKQNFQQSFAITKGRPSNNDGRIVRRGMMEECAWHDDGRMLALSQKTIPQGAGRSQAKLSSRGAKASRSGGHDPQHIGQDQISAQSESWVGA